MEAILSKTAVRGRFGISAKTSFFSGVIVFFILVIASLILLRFQSGMMNRIIDGNIRGMEKTLQAHGERQHTQGRKAIEANAEMLSKIAATALYNFDRVGLEWIMTSYIKMDEIQAVQVLDHKGVPFFAIWKLPDIRTGPTLPEALTSDNPKKFVFDSHYEKQFMGKLTVYYNNTGIDAQVAKSRQEALTAIAAFREIIDSQMNQAVGRQFVGIFCVVAILVLAVVICLRIFAIRPIERIIRGVNEEVSQFNSVSRQISSASTELAGGVDRQAVSLSDVMTLLEDMVRRAQASITCSEQLNRMGEEAGQVVSQVNSAWAALARFMEDIEEAGQHTSEIIERIESIAFQTRLLSLNAAVEATRAQKAGAGFAVVADEVRRFSERSAEAARMTKQRVDETRRVVQTGKDLMEKHNTAFGQVAENFASMKKLVADITLANRTQGNSIERINRAVLEADTVTHQNSDNARISASTSVQINGQARQLELFINDLSALVGNGVKNSVSEN
ncbi:hypothetical protein DENIS_0330 [Desulfonema ishimotonii]|uniref:Methyl-accepting transducer domain-containing protein n=1 Tax=Desulfonema ishimotonii TaxID=45657 RepID=A0A401FR03_9BACT|nr:methyl-accepting chemotaxis protein [Desulfonema ishimotonii]GBC59391.1 hypothetical protein DENIS_0330 [Desulfonema ishimotonii]